jgi:hypothetical protein
MAYNRIKHVKEFAKEYIEDCSYNSVKELTAEDIEFIGMEVQCNYQDICEILNIPLPESLGPVAA